MVDLSGKFSVLLPQLSEELATVVERLRRSVVAVRGRASGVGSGIIWDAYGLIVTNHHVLAGDEAEVLSADRRALRGYVVARNREADLAALRVPVTGQPAVHVRPSRDLRVGEVALAIGNPLGIPGAVTAGIITAVGPFRIADGLLREMVQADIELLPGNSGGPLADSGGRVVGINAMVASPGIGLAVPVETVMDFVRQINRGQDLSTNFVG